MVAVISWPGFWPTQLRANGSCGNGGSCARCCHMAGCSSEHSHMYIQVIRDAIDNEDVAYASLLCEHKLTACILQRPLSVSDVHSFRAICSNGRQT